MSGGRVIVAHQNAVVRAAVIREMAARGVDCAIAGRAAEVAVMQAALRSEAVVLGGEWAGEAVRPMLDALQRDVIHPYVLVNMRNGDRNEDLAMRRMGASEVVCGESPERICQLLERHLSARRQRDADGECALCLALRNLFSDYGIPCHLRGYRYLLFAARLIASGEGKAENLERICARAAERFGCDADSVKRCILRTVRCCGRRAGLPEPDNVSAFLNWALQTARRHGETERYRPRVTVLGECRRCVF